MKCLVYLPIYQGKKGIFGLDIGSIYARIQIAKSLPEDKKKIQEEDAGWKEGI